MNAPWTTRLDPKHTASYGVGELHQVCFEPPSWAGKGTTIVLGIPECELQFAFVADDRPIVAINRPVHNTGVKSWTRYACKLAAEYNAFLMLICDTAEQADIGARRVAKLLPRYRRVALERMYDHRSRVRERLS
jgi:hypothetical protein